MPVARCCRCRRCRSLSRSLPPPSVRPSVRQIDHSAVDTPSSRGRKEERTRRANHVPAAAAAIFWLAAWEFIRTEEGAAPLFIAGAAPLYCQLDPKSFGHFFNVMTDE